MKYLIASLIGLSTVVSVYAQQSPQPYVPLDQAQWEAMDRDIHKAPMSEEAHQFVHQVMTAYMRDAQQRAAQAKAREDAAKAESERKAQEAARPNDPAH